MSDILDQESEEDGGLQNAVGLPAVKPFPPLSFDFWLRSDVPEDIRAYLDRNQTLRDLADQVQIFLQLEVERPQPVLEGLKRLADNWDKTDQPSLSDVQSVVADEGGRLAGSWRRQVRIVSQTFVHRRIEDRKRRKHVIERQRRRDQTAIPALSAKAVGFYAQVRQMLGEDRDKAAMMWNDIDHCEQVAELSAYDGKVFARTGGARVNDYIVQARDVFVPTYTALGHGDPKVYFALEDLRLLNQVLLFARGIGMMRAIASGKTQAA